MKSCSGAESRPHLTDLRAPGRLQVFTNDFTTSRSIRRKIRVKLCIGYMNSTQSIQDLFVSDMRTNKKETTPSEETQYRTCT